MDFSRVQIVVTVPSSHLHEVLQAAGDAGAGILGHYTHCAFYSGGTGRFRPDEQATPSVGDRLNINEVDEYRIETFCNLDQVKDVVAAIRRAHPYEEPAIYLLPLLDEKAFG